MPKTANYTITRRAVDIAQSKFSDAVSPLLQRVLLGRGVVDDSGVSHHLQQLQRPESLAGLDEAMQLLIEALQQQQPVLIIGDFDADGATSSALMVLALRAMGMQSVDFLVPNRFEFGYGLTPEIVTVAVERFQPKLIITVDNGIASIDGVASAKSQNIKVIITDHHLPGETLPAADAIVNPNQLTCNFPSKNLAGVGVSFYLLSVLSSRLQTEGWFQQQKIAAPNMADYLDLVALGTVADVVPLDQNNRVLVFQGIQRIRSGFARPGILALLEIAGRQANTLRASDLGFIVGPRLNAAGRLDDMSLGIQCLLTDDWEQAQALAAELDQLNRERRHIESAMQAEALEYLEMLSEHNNDNNLPWGLCLYDSGWHQGVVGILASRMKDRHHRPVIAFANADDNNVDGLIKGSARSIPGLHIRDVLDGIATRHPQLLQKFGGHAMAAGLSIAKKNYPLFAKVFDEAVKSCLTECNLRAEIISDGSLHPSELNLTNAREINDRIPWGQSFPEPLFDGTFYLLQQRIVGQKHLKMVLSMDTENRYLVDAIAFSVDTDQWPDQQVSKVFIVYRLGINEYRGNESVQLIVNMIDKC